MATRKLLNKIGRRIHSIITWPFRAFLGSYRSILSFICHLLTDTHWLLDYFPSRKNGIRTILLVRLDLIGDFVIWLDSAKELKKIYPDSHLVLYANAIWADVARQFLYWDEVVAVNVPKLRIDDAYRIRVFMQIRRRGFHIAIQPTFSREYIGDLTIRSSAAPLRIGHVGDLNNISLAKKLSADTWYSSLVHVSLNAKSEFQYNEAFIKQLGQSSFIGTISKIPALCTLPTRLRIPESYILIMPGASWLPRAWPSAAFISLIKQLSSNLNYTIILCGGTDEVSLCSQISTLCPNSRVVNLAGQTTLIELIEIVRAAALLIANESSAIHIAAATNTPSVCITGGGHFGRFMPYPTHHTSDRRMPWVASHQMSCFGCKWKCKFELSSEQTVPCVSNIPLTTVLSAALSALDQPLCIPINPRQQK